MFTRKFFKRVLFFLAALLIFVMLLLTIIRLPVVQKQLTMELENRLTGIIGSEVKIERLFFSYDGNIQVDKFSVEDRSKDSLLSLKSLELDFNLSALLLKHIEIEKIVIDGLISNLYADKQGNYNFDFIIESFSSSEEPAASSTEKSGNTSPWSFSVEQILLSNFDIKYQDSLLALYSAATFKQLSLDVKKLDFDSSIYLLNNIRFVNAELDYQQEKAFTAKSDNEASTLLPVVFLEKLSLENIKVDYKDLSQQINSNTMDFELQSFRFHGPSQEITSQAITLDQSDIVFNQIAEPDTSTSAVVTKRTIFEWPDWKIDLKRTDLSFKNVESNLISGLFISKGDSSYNFKKSDLSSSLGLEMDSLFYQDEHLSIAKILLNSSKNPLLSGIELSTGVEVGNQTSALKKMRLHSPQSLLNLEFKTTYSTINEFLYAEFDKQKIELASNLSTINLGEVNEVLHNINDTVVNLAGKNDDLKLSFDLSSILGKLNIMSFYALYGAESFIRLSAEVENYISSNVNLTAMEAGGRLTKKDLSNFLPTNSPSFIPISVDFNLRSTFIDSVLDYAISVQSPEVQRLGSKGNIDLKQNWKYEIELNAEQVTQEFMHAKFLDSAVNISLQSHGSGIDPERLTNTTDIQIENVKIQNHHFSPIKVAISGLDGKYQTKLNYEDSVLQTSFLANGNYAEKSIKLAVELKGSLLPNAINLNDSLNTFAFQLKSNALISDELYDVKLSLDSVRARANNRYYKFKPLNISFLENNDTAQLYVQYENTTVDFNSSVPLSAMQFNDFTLTNFRKSNLIQYDEGRYKPLIVSAAARIEPNALFSTLTPASLEFDPIEIRYKFRPSSNQSLIDLIIPKLRYGQTLIDSASLKFDQIKDSTNLAFTVKKIEAFDFVMHDAKLGTTLNSDRSNFIFSSLDSLRTQLYNIEINKIYGEDSTYWSVDPQNIIVNGQKWRVNENNSAQFRYPNLITSAMKFQNGQERFSIKTPIIRADTSLQLNFDNFNLSNLTSIARSQKYDLNGIVNGEITFDHLAEFIPLSARLDLNQITYNEDTIGAFQLRVKNLKVQETDLRFTTEGVLASKGGLKLYDNDSLGIKDARIAIDKLDLPFFLSFSDSIFSEQQGYLSGDLSFDLNESSPVINGDLTFNNTSFRLRPVNTTFRISNTALKISDNQISLDNFQIKDEYSSPLLVNGTINLKDFSSPNFDLSVLSENFRVMNTTQPLAVEQIYGSAYLKTDFRLKGSIDQLNFDGLLQVNEKSSLNYELPAFEADLIQTDDLYYFASEQKKDSLELSRAEEIVQNNSTVSIKSQIKTDPQANFKIIIDEKRGDYLMLSGDSDLRVNMKENEELRLNGSIEVKSGYYQLSLYDLVQRKFTIQQGSTVEWTGDPYDGSLSITTEYAVKTSAFSLMQEQISGMSESQQNRYRQALNFFVYMNIDGDLNSPEISFELDMLESDRGAFNGSVYNQIQQINNDESRLNKQVFALLTLNQFFPTGNSSSRPDAELIARSSASQILSNQLNRLSDQYVKGINIDLDLESYQDYQSENQQTKTQLELNLSKRLFNDRFRVQVGNTVDLEGRAAQQQSAENIIGNIILEYMLTKDEQLSLKAYRKNEWEGLIDGQLVVTGISLQFNKDFQELSELWTKEKGDDDDK